VRPYVHLCIIITKWLPGGFRTIFHAEGWRSLYRGTSLALFGVSSGALQFMGYEEMKGWAFERKWRWVAKLGRAWMTDNEKLVRSPLLNLTYLKCCLEVQYRVYGHVWRIEAWRIMYDVPISGHPLAHTGTCTDSGCA
jgi:hypothetical protein